MNINSLLLQEIGRLYEAKANLLALSQLLFKAKALPARRTSTWSAARSHVQRLDGQPDSFDLDHRSRSRSQPPHSLANEAGEFTTTLTAPRRTSMRMSLGSVGGPVGAGNWTGTNVLAIGLWPAVVKAFGVSIGAAPSAWSKAPGRR